MEIKLAITGNQAEMRLIGDDGICLGRSRWEDKRDLSSQLFRKMDALLGRRGIPLKKIRKVSFVCDSPYFSQEGRWEDMRLENIASQGRCGFTAWQTGEIVAKVLNFTLEK